MWDAEAPTFFIKSCLLVSITSSKLISGTMFKPVLFAVAMSLIIDVCGYKQAGKGKSLPANIKTIAVPVFQNSSLKYRVEQRFTQAVIDEILKRARALRVVTTQDNADAVLNGDIRSFRAPGSILDDRGRTRVWDVRIVVSIVVRDLKTHKIIFQNQRMTFEGEYQLSDDPQSFFNEENPAVDRNRQGFRPDNRLNHNGRAVSGRPKKKSGPSFEELRREVEGGGIHPLYLFVGEEQYLQERALRLLYSTVDEALRVFNVSTFTIGSDNGFGSKTTAAMAIDAANQMPMMSARRVVVIREFDKIREDEQELVFAYVKRPAPTTTMVFQAVSPDKRRKLTTALVKACNVVTFDLLDEGRAKRWAQGPSEAPRVQHRAGRFEYVDRACRHGLTRLVNELEKLAAFADGGVIDSDTVQELVPRAREHTNWELWDAINAQDRRRALKLMERLLDDTDALPILGALASLSPVVDREAASGGRGVDAGDNQSYRAMERSSS
jgi:DNA polymerase III delta subunit